MKYLRRYLEIVGVEQLKKSLTQYVPSVRSTHW